MDPNKKELLLHNLQENIKELNNTKHRLKDKTQDISEKVVILKKHKKDAKEEATHVILKKDTNT